jgi:hypothetical protein
MPGRLNTDKMRPVKFGVKIIGQGQAICGHCRSHPKWKQSAANNVINNLADFLELHKLVSGTVAYILISLRHVDHDVRDSSLCRPRMDLATFRM